MKKLLLLTYLSFIALVSNAALSVGDMAVIGWNSDPAVSTKDFAVVALANIASGETIYFTDKGITLGAFQSALTTEGIFSLTTTSTISAGTVIKFSVTSGVAPGVTSSPSVGTLTVTEGWTSTSTASPFGNNGDQIIIFQGSNASPTFIFGFNAGINTTGLSNGWNSGGGTANNYSEIPSGLTNGTNAVGFGSASALDNYSYTGTIAGTKSTLLAAISNSVNWSTDDVNAYSLAPGGTQFPGANPIFKLGVLLSSSPILTFTSNPAAITSDDIASDGEGGSLSIADIDINVYNISNANGTLLPALSWQNNSFMGSSSASYSGLTNENNAGSKGMAIKSVSGNEFSINQFLYYNWGETSSFTNSVKGYRDGIEVASTTFDGFDVGYTPKTITLTTAFQNVDEVRFYISAGGYMGDQSATNHSINSIALASPVALTNSAPTDIALSASAINESVAANSTVGTLSSSDPDAGNTFTYTLVAGTGDSDNASFNISGNSLRITASPDFETRSSYSVRLRTTDQGSLNIEKQFTITINDINEAPTDIALSASAINENVAANSTVGTLSSSDPDAGNTFTYTLVAGTGDSDNASFNISGNSLRITASPDFETRSSYSVRLRTTDQGSLTFEKQFTITINDLCDIPTPTITANGPTTFCSGGSVTLTSSSASGNVWSNGPASQSIVVSAGGTYTLSVTIGACTSATTGITVSSINCAPASALNFDGVDDYVTIPYVEALTDVTHEFWFKTSVANQGIFSITDNNPTPGGFDRDIYLTDGNINCYLWAGGPTEVITTTGTNYADNIWHHIAHVVGQGGQKLYVDGVLKANGTFATSSFNWNTKILLGYSNTSPSNKFYNGSLDEVRIWNRALCQGEIQNNRLGEILTTANGLVANYHFNQGLELGNNAAITSLADVSGNSNSGSLINFTLSGNGSNWVNPGAVTSGLSVTPFTFPATPTITAGGPTTFCSGGSVTLTSSSVSGNTWSTGATSQSIVVLAGGTYTVGVTNAGCASAASLGTKVIVNPLPITTVTQGGALTADQAGATYQWYKCPAQFLTSEINQSFTPTVTGDYKVDVTLAGCKATSNCINVIVTSIDDNGLNPLSSFKMYPNPSKGLVNFESEKNGEILIINTLGQVVRTVTIVANSFNLINVDELNEGTYFVKGANDFIINTQKLVIQK